MQKPLQLSDEMKLEIENEISALATKTKEEISKYIPRPKNLASGAEQLTSERRQTHGNFRDNARLSQMLKETFRSTASWPHLDDVEKESLDMIALKISRILSGKSL